MRIGAVEPGGPAERAGLREGDVLLSLDGAQLMGTDDLIRLLDAERIGRDTSVTILRDGKVEPRQLRPVERGRGSWIAGGATPSS